MKKYLAPILFILTFMLSVTSCSANRIFSDIPSGNGITKVYIGKAMMKLAGVSSFSSMPEVKDAVKSVDNIEVITCENRAKIPEVREKAQQIIHSMNLEQVVDVDDDGEITQIYMCPDKDNEGVVSLLIITCDEDSEYTIVCIRGKIDPSQFYDM